jgi:hypothetical protein
MKCLWRFEPVEYNPDCIFGIGKSNHSPLSSLQPHASASVRPELAARTNGKLSYRCIFAHRHGI